MTQLKTPCVVGFMIITIRGRLGRRYECDFKSVCFQILRPPSTKSPQSMEYRWLQPTTKCEKYSLHFVTPKQHGYDDSSQANHNREMPCGQSDSKGKDPDIFSEQKRLDPLCDKANAFKQISKNDIRHRSGSPKEWCPRIIHNPKFRRPSSHLAHVGAPGLDNFALATGFILAFTLPKLSKRILPY